MIGAPASPDLPPEQWLERQALAALHRSSGDPAEARPTFPPAARHLQVRTADKRSARAFLRQRGLCERIFERASCHADHFANEDAAICGNAANPTACRADLERLSGWSGDPPYAVVLLPERGQPQILSTYQEIADVLKPRDTEDEALLSFALYGGWEDARVAPLPDGGYFIFGARHFGLYGSGGDAYWPPASIQSGGCQLPHYPPWTEPKLGSCEPIGLSASCNSIPAIAWSCPIVSLPDVKASQLPGDRTIPAKAIQARAGGWQGGTVRRLSFDVQPHIAEGYLRAFGAEDAAICGQERVPHHCRKTLAERAKALTLQEGFRPDTWVLAGILDLSSGREPVLDIIPQISERPTNELGAKLLAVRAMEAWTPQSWSATRTAKGWLVEGPSAGGERRKVLVENGWGTVVQLQTAAP